MKKRSKHSFRAFLYYIHGLHLVLSTSIIKTLIYPFFFRNFKQSYEGKKELPRGPYLLMADHVSYLDPVVVSLGIHRPVRWIAADGNFRNPFMRLLFTGLAGAVCKTKNHSDMESLRDMKIIADNGGIIGLFPEGEMSWDGVDQPMYQGTDKLVRFLKIPVVYCHMEGVYLSYPRWSPHYRPRPVKLRYEQIINAEEAGRLKLTEIRERIESVIQYDDLLIQEKDPVPLKGGAPALGMERVFFTCPSCREINSLKTDKTRIYCLSCSWEMTVDLYGRPGEGMIHKSFHQWNLWQQRLLYDKVQKKLPDNGHFWTDKGVVLYCGKPKRMAKKVLQGQAEFHRDRIVISGNQKERTFPLSDVTGLNVFKAHFVEFLYNKMQYRLDFQSIPTSGMKWEILFRMLMNQWKDREDNQHGQQ